MPASGPRSDGLSGTRFVLLGGVLCLAFVFWTYPSWEAGVPPVKNASPSCPASAPPEPCPSCPKPDECPICKKPTACPPPQQPCPVPSPSAPPEKCPLSHEPVNFEPPRPNSLTGPRLNVLKKRQKSFVPRKHFPCLRRMILWLICEENSFYFHFLTRKSVQARCHPCW